MLFLSKVIKGHLRQYSGIATRSLESLNHRSLIRVKGNEAPEFLQGLITNDIDHLGKSSNGSMYTMFLNTKGRVLYDAIIYKIGNDSFFIECDLEIVKSLQKHMMLYRVRRKIDISSIENEYIINVLFNVGDIKNKNEFTKQDNCEDNLPQTSTSIQLHKNLMIFKDPRVSELGYRIISNSDINVKQEINDLIDTSVSDHTRSYKELRYSLGVGEGIIDLPVGNCFPLECNCDYLHGVSFHKGCYIGQELTARTHHTGVVRKRLMPLYFKKAPSSIPTGKIMVEKTNLGKLRGIEGNMGLALLRIDLALELGEIKIENESAIVSKPHWWPVILPKEKIIQKS